MRKTIILLLVAGLLILAASQTALAFGLGNGRGMKDRSCVNEPWFASLAPEVQQQITEIREAHKEQAVALREEMRTLRAEGKLEELRAARQELVALKQETRDKIIALLPEEYRDDFQAMGHGKKRGFRGNMMQDISANRAGQL